MTTSLDIPQQAAHILDALEHTHVRARIIPAQLEHLGYELAVPKDWAHADEFGPVPGGPLETRGLGFFASANLDGAPVIAVTGTAVPYEVPIDAWAHLVFEREGWTVVAANWFPGPSGLFFDITGTRVLDDVMHVRRSGVRVTGSEIVMLNCQCADAYWDGAKGNFWVALVTFEPAAKGSTRMEPWIRGSASDPDFEFAHPGSWLSERVESTVSGVAAVDVRLPDAAGETLLGYVQVHAQRLSGAPVPNLTELESSAMKRLEASGFIATGAVSSISQHDDPRSIAVDGWLGGFTGVGALQGAAVVALRGYVLRRGVVFTLSMLRSRTEENPLLALRARRVFEIARSTLTLLRESNIAISESHHEAG